MVNGHLIVKSSVAFSETGKKKRNTGTLTLGNGHFSVKSCATFCCVAFSENDTLKMYMCILLVNDHLGVKNAVLLLVKLLIQRNMHIHTDE